MEYQFLDADGKANHIRTRLTALENEHYGILLNKIANAGKAEVLKQLDVNLRHVETAIEGLRDELDRLEGDATVATTEATSVSD